MAARRVVKPLRRLMTGRTTIMITHDLNLAPDADRILVVDRGRIVETGRHEELLARGGAYARLHRSQNNAVTDTGELRMPLFTEGLAEAPAAVAQPAYGYQGHGGYQGREGYEGYEGHGSYEAWQAPSYGYDQYAPAPVPTALPDGRALFRDEEPWPGI